MTRAFERKFAQIESKNIFNNSFPGWKILNQNAIHILTNAAKIILSILFLNENYGFLFPSFVTIFSINVIIFPYFSSGFSILMIASI